MFLSTEGKQVAHRTERCWKGPADTVRRRAGGAKAGGKM